MDDYLIGRETLGRFVDELFKMKPLQVNNPEELNKLRETKMREVDDSVMEALFGKLDESQMAEFEQLLDKDEQSEEVFKSFFNKVGIDPQKTITEVMQAYSQAFLGGKNE